MSLFAPRPETERASVLLPNVTCSSCSASIPLSSLGEHVCAAAPPRGLANRNVPRPSQISIPQARPAMARQPSSQGRGPLPTNVPPPFAGPSSAHPSPSEFSIPRRPSATNLSPHDGPSGSYSAYPIPVKTPSPTNPFFPHPDHAQSTSSVHGLGMGAVEPQSSPMIDTTSGGESGMAGVGRRAFAAAAWGVRAGVALAKQHMEAPATSPSYQTSNPAWPQPQPVSPSSAREPPILPRVPLSGRQHSGPSPIFGARPEMHHSHTAPMESTYSYSPPRANPASPPRRSASAMSHRSNPSSPPRRKESLSSNASSRSGQGESISQLLRARTNTAPAKSNKPGFFDKVKEMHERSNTVSPVLGIGMARSTSGGSGSGRITSSPQTTTFDLEDDDYDDQQSALPWATPSLDESPMMNRDKANGMKHHRYPTAGSEASSSSSSSRSGRWGATSGESEEVVTPSQSLEMLSDRVSSKSNHEAGMRSFSTNAGGVSMEGRDILDQIGEEDEEEDEGDMVVFGTPTSRNIKDPHQHQHHNQKYLPNSHSTSTITSVRPYLPTTVPHSSPNRIKGLPSSNENTPMKSRSNSHSHSHKSSTSSSNSISSTTISSNTQRRNKVCVKCGEAVGGSKRFVERDGIVLCEKDWKKMYLPSCRRCNLPIEKSAVSSSDGQLKGKWHRTCFTCFKCDKPFEGDDFYVLNGRPFCQFHYHEENGTLCASSSCHQPIEGSCIVTPGPNPQRFHPGHLKCDHRGGVSGAQNCREPMDEYYEIDGSRYCERHVGEALKGNRSMKAEKRRTRLVDLPFGVGGF